MIITQFKEKFTLIDQAKIRYDYAPLVLFNYDVKHHKTA